MASVKPLLDEDGKARAYKVRYRNAAGQPRSKTFPKGHKADADRFATRVEADKITGTELDPRGERMTVGEYAADWTAVLPHVEGSRARVQDALILFRTMLGDRMIRKVRQSDIRAWLEARGQQVAAGTVKTDYGWVRAMFGAAVADGVIRTSPCDGVRLEAPQRRQMVVPDRDGVLAIAGRLPASWAMVGPLGARSGLRPAELLGLCVEQVDFLRMEVAVDRQMVGGVVKLEPKTSASRRTVPLDEDTIRLLAGFLEAQPLGPAVTVWERKTKRGPLEAAGQGRLIFHRRDGGPISHRAANDTWRRQAARAGQPGVRIHDMRHFFASQLIRQGASVVLVSQLLGHSRPSITADIYAHEFEDRDQRARELMAAVWAPAPADDAVPVAAVASFRGSRPIRVPGA